MLKFGNNILILGGLIIIALFLWCLFSFGFDLRREESVVAVNFIKTMIGG